MRAKTNKKAAVEMSLNLIIMLIIGIVVLGLVISFVNNLVSQGETTYRTQLDDNEKLKLDEVDRCPENLCMIPDPSVEVAKGADANIFIKVRAFSAEDISCNPGPLPAEGDTSCQVEYSVVDDLGTTGLGGDADAGIVLSGPGFNANIGEHDSKMYTLRATNGVPVGTYYLTLKLFPGTEDETSRTLTIDVS